MAKRIDNFENLNIDKNICDQHGVFMMHDNTIATVEIISKDSAVVTMDKISDINELIEEFRFYAEHITKFYNSKNELIKEFPSLELKEINIDDLQPSQFFIDKEKLSAVSSFVNDKNDLIIPTLRINNINVCLDGHTRLYAALEKGIETAYIFETNTDDYIYDFVKEARHRKISSIKSLKLLSHDEYCQQWHAYCDNYFRTKNEE